MLHKVLDTNIILSDATNLISLARDGSIIVLPETVIHELDSKKSGFDEINFQAREFARIMVGLKQDGEPVSINGLVVTALVSKDVSVMVVSKDRYDSVDAATPVKIINDQRIIEVAKRYQESLIGEDSLIFLSLDLMCRLTANTNGLKVGQPEVKVAEKLDLFKSVELDSVFFNQMQGKPISAFDDTHKLGNFSYEFTSPDGNSMRAIVNNGLIDVLREDEFTRLTVKPINQKQKLWCKAILSDQYDLQVLEAKAGTGKNLTSVASAMRLIDINPEYNKIIYIRNSIESIDKGADVGYLAGNDEKFRIYNMPLYDTIDYIAKESCSAKDPSREAIDTKASEITEKYAIETMWVGEARGRTLSNAIVIMDEWQNSSDNTTQLILSRLDDTCKAIVIGSNRQIDNPYLNKHNNGLTSLLRDLTRETVLKKFSISLDKAVRGKFAEFAETLFEKD